MKYTENAINILTVKTYKGIGRAWVVKNLKGNETVEQIVSLLMSNSKQDEQITLDDFEFSKNQLLNRLGGLETFCDGLVAIGDKNFPKYRGNVKESEQPIFLFYKGDINLLGIENNNITVIGALNLDTAIETREQKLFLKLLKRYNNYKWFGFWLVIV
ncbi:MAG: hypothetical protein IPL50_20155 [Chitinophagaceae bacterium]|nr:hypothetical protein [Chitinophagaceae bacterium]